MDCNSFSTNAEFSNQQLKCFSPEIPNEERIYFTSDLYYEISLIYYLNKGDKDSLNKIDFYNEIKCEKPEHCQMIFSNKYDFILKSIEPAIVKPDDTITLRIQRNFNVFNYFREIKVYLFLILHLRIKR